MRIILIILIFPLALFGLDNNLCTAWDAATNVVLELTVNYLVHKNYVEPNLKLEITAKNDEIDWDDAQLIKW